MSVVCGSFEGGVRAKEAITGLFHAVFGRAKRGLTDSNQTPTARRGTQVVYPFYPPNEIEVRPWVNAVMLVILVWIVMKGGVRWVVSG